MKCCLLLLFIIAWYYGKCQEPEEPMQIEEQAELAAGMTDQTPENDEWLQKLEIFRRHKIDLNTSTEDELSELLLLQPLQIVSFIQYRKLLGRLIDLHELQAIPGWDVQTIKTILPYVKIGSDDFSRRFWKERLAEGEKIFLIRMARVLETSKGFMPGDSNTHYLGSPYKTLFRYSYNFKNLLRFGVIGDKDAGEPFDLKKIKSGIDFYSFHFLLRRIGQIKTIALGDYTINMGQGLIQWQSFAYKMSASVINCKRQGETVLPYTSSGEFSFNRGMAGTYKWNNFESTFFVSKRKVSANTRLDENGNTIVSSVLNSGYHRTEAELEDRNQLGITSFGGDVKYVSDRGHVAINGVSYSFSIPIQKSNQPYNMFAIKGKTWANYSFDYSFTLKNVHSFGEFAIDQNKNIAFVSGMLASLDAHIDVAFVFRKITASYQAMFANAFTQHMNPTNESGLYSGISIKPSSYWKIDSYIDIFRFPWLSFNIDAPSYGKEIVCKVSWQPNKQVEIYSSLKYIDKPIGISNDNFITKSISSGIQRSWRMNFSFQASKQLSLQGRVECTRVKNANLNFPSDGWIGYTDVSFKPSRSKVSGNLRFAWFETQDYESRLFAYENDVQYSFSVSQLYGSGCRYYVNLKLAESKKVGKKNKEKKVRSTASIKWSQTFYVNRSSIGSGLDEIDGTHRSDIRIQLLLRWQ